MNLLHQMQVFSKVYEEQNFSKVSKSMQMNTSSVSRVISKLEDELNAPLFIRNTRKMVPTELGETFYQRCQTLLEMLAEIQDEFITFEQKKLKLHVCLTARFFTSQILNISHQAYPEIDIEISSSDRMPDIIQENIDFTLVYTSLKDSGLIARKLADGNLGLFAKDDCLDKLILPKDIADKVLKSGKIGKIPLTAFSQIITASNFSQAFELADEMNYACVLPDWYKMFIKSPFKIQQVFNGEELLGANLGLYLVYTYKRYKNTKGSEVVNSIIDMVKSHLYVQ